MHHDNTEMRFGSARFAEEGEIARAGMFRESGDAFFSCFFGKRPLFYHGDGGVLICAGARGGKLRDLLGYNVCAGFMRDVSLVVLDLKGELAAISQDQTPDKKHCYYWNVAGLHGLPQHRLNPLDYMNQDNPSLISDVKVFCENILPDSGSANGKFFEARGREFLEGIILTLVQIHGVLTFPDLYRAVNLIPGNTDEYLDLAWHMSEAGYPISKRIEEEIAASRENEGSGFKGILGEIFKALAPLSDDRLMASVSPDENGRFDFSMEDLCNNDRKHQVYLMPPAEFVGAWAPVIKAIFVAAMIYKARRPDAPRVTFLLDECAQLSGFPLIPRLFTYGAGIGIRPVAIFQSTYQMNALGPSAENIITSSAALRIYFATRDIESATSVSRMLGAETLEYEDEHRQLAARRAKDQLVETLLSGGDPLKASLDYSHHKREAAVPTKQHRLLRTPDEVLNTPGDRAYIFTDALEHPIYAERRPYYEQRFMAGRYLNNPYHPDARGVRVKTLFGHAWRRILRGPVPERYADYPQYRDGLWSRIAPQNS